MAKRYTANKIQKRERECLHVDVDVDDENEIDYEHFGKVAIMASNWYLIQFMINAI